MPKYPKKYRDVGYYAPGRKRPIAGSTVAISNFLVMVHNDYPNATISELREIITDRSRYILFPDAVAVLDAYIKVKQGDHIPNWR